MPEKSLSEQALEALKAGDPQKAAELLDAQIAKSSADPAPAPAKPAEPPPPRAPEAILHDFMVAVADKMGNHAALEQLAAEFESVTAAPKAK